MKDLLLKVNARITEKRLAEGDTAKVAKRYLPWVTAEEFAKSPNSAIDEMIDRMNKAVEAGSISGTTTEGEVVVNEPVLHDMTGSTAKTDRPKLNRARFLVFLAKGITLAQQQEMQTLIAKKYGVKAKKDEKDRPEEETV